MVVQLSLRGNHRREEDQSPPSPKTQPEDHQGQPTGRARAQVPWLVRRPNCSNARFALGKMGLALVA